MKNFKSMKHLFYITLSLLFVSLGVNATAQNTKEERKAAREIRKAEEAKWQKEQFAIAKQALLDGSFVIEADQLIYPRGEVENVSSITNFISMKDDKVSVQIAVMNHMPGYNGLGGLTVDGTPSKIETKTLKNGIFLYKFSVSGVAISANIEIQLNGDGNNVSATILPNFSNRKLTMRGRLVLPENSKVFKGSSI